MYAEAILIHLLKARQDFLLCRVFLCAEKLYRFSTSLFMLTGKTDEQDLLHYSIGLELNAENFTFPVNLKNAKAAQGTFGIAHKKGSCFQRGAKTWRLRQVQYDSICGRSRY